MGKSVKSRNSSRRTLSRHQRRYYAGAAARRAAAKRRFSRTGPLRRTQMFGRTMYTPVRRTGLMRPAFSRAQLQRQTGEIVRQIVKGSAETKSYFIKDCLRTPWRPDTGSLSTQTSAVPADLYVNAYTEGNKPFSITKPWMSSTGNLSAHMAHNGKIDAKQLMCYRPFDFLLNKPKSTYKLKVNSTSLANEPMNLTNSWETVSDTALSDIPSRQGMNGIEGSSCSLTSMVFSGLLRSHRFGDPDTYSLYAGIKPIRYRFVMFETKEPLPIRFYSPDYTSGGSTISGGIPPHLQHWSSTRHFDLEKGESMIGSLDSQANAHYYARSKDSWEDLGPFDYKEIRADGPINVMKHNSNLNAETTWINDTWDKSPGSNLKRVIKDIRFIVRNGKAGQEIEIERFGETRNTVMGRVTNINAQDTSSSAQLLQPGNLQEVPGNQTGSGEHDFKADTTVTTGIYGTTVEQGTGPDGQWDPRENSLIHNLYYESGYTKEKDTIAPVFVGQRQFKIVVKASELGVDGVGSTVDFHSASDEFLPHNCKRNIYVAMCTDQGIPALQEQKSELLTGTDGRATSSHFVPHPGKDLNYDAIQNGKKWNDNHVELNCMMWFKDF